MINSFSTPFLRDSHVDGHIQVHVIFLELMSSVVGLELLIFNPGSWMCYAAPQALNGIRETGVRRQAKSNVATTR